MSPLVRGQVHGLAVLVADVAVFQPAVERVPVTGVADRALSVDVRGRAGEQDRGPVRPAFPGPVLLIADQRLELVVDRHQRASRFIFRL